MVTTTFCMERMLDLLAARVGLDPVEVRRRNLIADDELPFVNALGVSFDATSFRGSLEAAVGAIGYEAFRARQKAAWAEGRLTGLGIACYPEFTTPSATVLRARGVRSVPGFDAATVRVNPSGTVEVFTSVTAMGQGLMTALGQLVADECGVRLEDVVVQCGDPNRCPYGSGSWESRGAVAGGGAVLMAARQIRDKVLAIAAQRLEVSVADLVCEEGRIWVRGRAATSIAGATFWRIEYARSSRSSSRSLARIPSSTWTVAPSTGSPGTTRPSMVMLARAGTMQVPRATADRADGETGAPPAGAAVGVPAPMKPPQLGDDVGHVVDRVQPGRYAAASRLPLDSSPSPLSSGGPPDGRRPGRRRRRG
jgi:CO/xanthine dehydrogenase Mo-binding subunit